ncbi:MAG TPA: ester cyclase [Nocardioides sp.]|nr:ester cyclase [Nocardioides sp.]
MTTDLSTVRPRTASLAYIDAVNEGRLDRLPDLVTGEVVDHHLPPELPAGVEGLRVWVDMLRTALQLHIQVNDVVDAGDRVAVQGRITGTHVGDFAGMPATGRSFDAAYMSFERVVDGRIAERWEVADTATITTQLMAAGK